MKNLFLFLALTFGIVSMNSCTKDDVTTPCPTNPFNNESLCGVWNRLDVDSGYTETWTISRNDDGNLVEISNTYVSSLTYPFSVSNDTTFIRYEGSDTSKFKMSGYNDTIVLVQTYPLVNFGDTAGVFKQN